MKKLLSLLLALAMVLSVCVFAVAEEVPVITIAAPERINIEDWNTNQTTPDAGGSAGRGHPVPGLPRHRL